MGNFIKILRNNTSIILLLLIASTLRFYNFFELQYTYDELSALNRLEFNSFSELIQKGVMPDGHPALVQVFLYYYSKIVGTTEWLIKLPFILAGIASVYITYTIGKRWFSETAGLFSAAIIASSEYFIFYSVTARPYISGLFLSLLTLKYWIEVIFDPSSRNKKYFYFALFAAFSALNHHFSMLFAALCGVFGLFFSSKLTFKKYLFSCLGAILIYLPHLPVLLAQLKTGGVGAAGGGWLNPPENNFIIEYIYYVFHYSVWFISVFILVIIFSFFSSKQNHLTQNKIRIALFSLFIFSFLIGFLYSIKVNPVIQFSTLIFAVPCLLLFFASFAGELSLKKKWICLALLLTTGIYTLTVKRKYYDYIFKQSFDTYIKTADETIKEKGNNNVYSLFKGEPWFLNFYKKKHHSSARFEVIENEAYSLFDYKARYDTLRSKYLILADFNPAQLLQASQYFPFVYKKTIGFGYEIYVLSKEPPGGNLEIEKHKVTGTNFIDIPQGFDCNKTLIINDKDKNYYRIDSLNEYPISFKIKNTDLHCKEGESVVVEIKYMADKPIKGLICGSTDANKKNIYWATTDIDAFYRANEKIHTAYFSTFAGTKFNDAENELTLFIWNNKKEKFLLSEFSVYVWNNNPYHYGLLSDF